MFDCDGIMVLDHHYCEDVWRLANNRWWAGFVVGLVVMFVLWIAVSFLAVYIDTKRKKDETDKSEVE
jgi:hypothetical protein